MDDKTSKKVDKLKQFARNPDLAKHQELSGISDSLEGINESLADKSPKQVEITGKKSDVASAFFEMLRGDQGETGPEGPQGPKGEDSTVVGPKGDQGEKGKDGKDGKDGLDGIDGKDGVDGKDGQNGKDGKSGSPDTAIEIKDKLQTLNGEDRLDVSAIKGMKELERTLHTKIDTLPKGGVGGVTVSQNGTLKGSGQALNFIGATVTNDGHTSNITTSSGLIVTEIDGSPSVSNPTSIKFSNGAVTDNGDGTVTVTTGSGGGGDFSSNTTTSVDSELVLFSGTGGKTGKRATGTGIATLTSGVLSATATTGSGSVVLATSPTLVTPTLGAATATTVNKVTVTAPATGSTLTIDDGLTLHATGNVTALSGSHTGTSSGTNSGDVTLAGENYISNSGQVITAAAVNLSGTNATGTLAAARFPALTGDVITTAGTVATTIAGLSVTYAKIQNVSTNNRLLGRATTGAGTVEEITVGSGLSITGTTLSATGGGTGTVTATAGSLTSNAVVLGAGTTDTKVAAGITTDGTSVLNLGVNTTTIGKVKMFGNTSGDATIQPAAVAGTATVLTLPAVTGTLATLAGTETFTNKTLTSPTLTTPALGTPASGNLANCTFPTLNQNTSGSAATLTTPRAIYGNNFDGSAALSQIIASTYGGTGNGFTKFSGPVTTEKTKTLRDATDTILELGGSYTPTGTWTSMTLVTPALGTPASGTLTNATGLPISGLVASTSTAIGVGSVELGHASDTTLSRSSAGVLAVEGVVIPSISSTNTLTNKWLQKRFVTTTQSATPTINTDNGDIFSITALAQAITSMTTNLSGTGVAGQMISIEFTDNGTARAITWGTSFANGGLVNLPTTTVISTRLRVLLEWSTVASKWECIAVA